MIERHMWCPHARSITLAALLALSSACSGSATDPAAGSAPAPTVREVDPPASVLFVGNSFTYYSGGIERHLQRLAASGPTPVQLTVARRTTPSQSLSGHYHDPRTDAALKETDWDVVVLQGKSDEPLGGAARDSFFRYAKALAGEVERKGADTALFMTWAYRNAPEMTAALSASYVTAGNEIGAIVVPVGLAFARVAAERSNRYLFSDNRHPSVEGSYLAACVFYASLFGASPAGFSYTAGLPPEQAEFLQRIAWETAAAFYVDAI